jgi:hypothetical protein
MHKQRFRARREFQVRVTETAPACGRCDLVSAIISDLAAATAAAAFVPLQQHAMQSR